MEPKKGKNIENPLKYIMGVLINARRKPEKILKGNNIEIILLFKGISENGKVTQASFSFSHLSAYSANNKEV